MNYPYHWDSCNLSQGLKTDRHNHCVSHTARLLRSVGYGVEIEPRRHCDIVFEERGLKRPDLSYTSGGVTKYIDVVVATPTSSTTMHGVHISLEVLGGAAIQAEARKRHDYSNLPAGVVVTPTPFTFESTGR